VVLSEGFGAGAFLAPADGADRDRGVVPAGFVTRGFFAALRARPGFRAVDPEPRPRGDPRRLGFSGSSAFPGPIGRYSSPSA
jgi:hypothetical protein